MGLGSIVDKVKDKAKDVFDDVKDKAIDEVKDLAKEGVKTVVKGGLAYVTGGASLLFDDQIDKVLDKGVDKLADGVEKRVERATEGLFGGDRDWRADGPALAGAAGVADDPRGAFAAQFAALLGPEAAAAAPAGSPQAAFLAALRPADGAHLNEEQTFALAAFLRTLQAGGPAAASEFLQAFARRVGEGGGAPSVEKAVVGALRDLAEKGVLPPAKADAVYAEAFAAGQLDGNAGALYDSQGDTRAVAKTNDALARLFERLSAIDGGEAPAPRKLADARPDAPTHGSARGGSRGGLKVDGPQGFLFKPVSDNDGKLVVLLPKGLTGEVEELVLRGPDGRVLERGRFTSVANGDREHFRFSRTGADYPPGVTVEAVMKDGSVKDWKIADPSQRND